MSSSVLALLVALVSVSSLALPAAIDALTKANSRIIATYSNAIGNSIYFTVSNTGNRPGSIGDAEILITNLEGTYSQSISIAQQGTPAFIEPSQFANVEYRVEKTQLISISDPLISSIDLEVGELNCCDGWEVRLNVTSIDFNGERQIHSSIITYDDFRRDLVSLSPECMSARKYASELSRDEKITLFGARCGLDFLVSSD